MVGRLLALVGVKQNQIGATRNVPNPIPLSLTNPNQWNELVDLWSGTGQTALRVAAFFACVDRISKDIASLPLSPMRRTSQGQEVAYDYDQFFISEEPSPNYTAYTWQYLQNQVLCRYSECFAPIKRRNGRPIEYGFWHPLEVELKKVGGKKYWINTKTKDVVNDDDMLHPMWFTLDGERGYPITSLMADTLELGKNAKKMASTQYKNMNWQAGYLSIKGDLDDAQAKLIGENWKVNTTGEANSSMVGVLDNGSEWKNFGGSLKDSELSTIMAFTDEQIARFMGVHPSKIGIRNANVSYNSLEQENIGYVQDTIQPRIASWEQELNRKVISDTDKGVIFFKYELKSRLRGDINTRKDFYREMLMLGVFTQNDVLNLEDMKTGGKECDERYVNAATVTLKSVFSGENTPKSADSELLFKEYIKSKSTNGHAITEIQHS